MHSIGLRRHLVIGLGVSSIALSHSAFARIEITPRLSAAAIWSDNVDLDSNQRASDVIFELGAGANLRADTSRLKGSVDYAPTVLLFLDHGGENDIRQSLNGALTGEVVRDTLFVDARGAVGQRFLDNSGPLSAGNANFTSNRRTVQSYSVSPRVQHGFGTFANASARYLFGVTEVGNSNGLTDISSGVRQEVNVGLDSGARFTRLSWSLDASYDRIERDLIDANFEEYVASVSADYALGRHFGLLGSVGYEEITDPTLNRDINGVIWDTGFRWSPGPRTRLIVRGGRRFGDTVFSGNFSYRLSDTSTLQARYSDDVSVFGRVATDNLGNIFDIINGIPVDAGGVPLPINDGDLSITDRAFRSRRAELGFSQVFRKLSVNFRSFYERRTFSIGTFNEETYGLSSNATWALGRGQSISTGADLRLRNRDANTDNLYYTVRAEYGVEVGRGVKATLGAVHSSSQNDGPGRDFVTNLVRIGIFASF